MIVFDLPCEMLSRMLNITAIEMIVRAFKHLTRHLGLYLDWQVVGCVGGVIAVVVVVDDERVIVIFAGRCR